MWNPQVQGPTITDHVALTDRCLVETWDDGHVADESSVRPTLWQQPGLEPSSEHSGPPIFPSAGELGCFHLLLAAWRL